MAAAALLSLLIATVAVAGLGGGAPGSADTETVDLSPPSVFHELPPLVTDLRPDARRPHYIKLDVVVEVPADLVPRLRNREAVVVDAIRSVLRDYERSDPVGAAGTRRLRSDIHAVLDNVLQPATARDVLFKELVVD